MKQVKMTLMVAISPNHKRNKIPHPAFSASVFVFIGAPEMAKPQGRRSPRATPPRSLVLSFPWSPQWIPAGRSTAHRKKGKT